VTDGLVYNIPAKLIENYRGHEVILRSSSPGEIAYSLWQSDPLVVRFIQLLAPFDDTSVLERSVEELPIEIVLEDLNQFELLYDFTNLLDSHPLRVTIPVARGFSKAVKLAVSLDYAVKLQVGQPEKFLRLELESVRDVYLRRNYVRQPIEFFQSLLLSFYREEKISLWEVAEENSTQIRYITDDGRETIAPRFADADLGNLNDFCRSIW
jgi:hypothetical protein